MIEDKENKIKIAESPEEELVNTAKENTKKRIMQTELALEIDKVVLEYLNNKCKEIAK